MRRRRAPAIAVFAALVLFTTHRAVASEADDVFERGRAAMEAGRYDEACGLIAQSHRMEPLLPKLAFLGVCHERAGKTATAWHEYNEVAEQARRAGLVDRESKARELASALEPRLRKVRIVVLEAVPGLAVTCDGRALPPSALEGPFPLDPGNHEFAVSAPGRAAWTTTVGLDADGTTTEVHVPPLARIAPAIAELPQAPATVQPDAPPPPRSNVPAYIVGGVGLAGLAFGTIFGLRALDKRSESDAECEGGCTTAGVELNEQSWTAAYVSTAAFAVGALGVGVTAVLLITNRTPRGPAKSVALSFGPGAVGATGVW